MSRSKILRCLAYVLLFAMIAASVPLHQIFHKHASNSSYTLTKDKSGFKTPEKSCCKLVHLLQTGILVSFVESPDQAEPCSLVSSFLADTYIAALHLFLNKAPPVVLA